MEDTRDMKDHGDKEDMGDMEYTACRCEIYWRHAYERRLDMEHTGNRDIKDAGDMEDTRDMEGL